MSKKGRKVPKLAVIDKTEVRRPIPHAGMHPAARRVWVRIVKAYPPDHFKPPCLDLLRIHCEAAAAHKVLMKRYTDSNYEDTAALRAADKLAARCQGMSVKLGLNLNNRMMHRGQGPEAPRQKSKRDRLLFGGRKR